MGRTEPNAQQLRTDKRRLVPHGRRRRLLRRSRSARQQSRLRRIADGRRRALRRAHRSDEEHPSRAEARRAIPLQLERADPAEQARREERVHGGAVRLQEHRPRRLVGEDQPRPHARHRSQQAADARRRPGLDGARPQRRHGGVQQHHDDRPVAAQEGLARRRHRRRSHSSHARRRQDVDEDREVPERARDDIREPRRLVAGGRGNALRHARRPPQQRLQAVRREEHRLRHDVDVDRRESSRTAARCR